MKLQINIQQFYNVGMICFAIIGVANLFNLIRVWGDLHPLGRISTGFSIIFNFALVFFFSYLKNQAPTFPEDKMPDPEKLESFLNNLK